MANIDLAGFLDEPIEMSHQFVVELNCLVVVNHKLTLEAIDREENKELDKLGPDLSDEPDVGGSMRSDLQRFHDDLRTAANNMAAVALVTRIQHWIGRFVKKTKKNPGKAEPGESGMVSELRYLNAHIGEDGPVEITLFAELVNVRDSVIHADSKTKWLHRGKERRVAVCYANAYGETEIDGPQLKDAIAKGTQQVEWYDDKLSKAGRGQHAKQSE
jgi:hypothetical protein